MTDTEDKKRTGQLSSIAYGNKGYQILPNIHQSEDIKTLSLEELNQLAAEIRRYMLDVVSQKGGHLAPNLGVVELTLALHLAFELPKDKIIWDVGHQCYTHKIITGRRDAFATLRCHGGLSGFPKSSESPADCFETGHSSTSVSAAVGFAKARDILGQDYHVAAVMGDGALTGGLAYEGLNNAGDLQCPLIVVLNDNEMSIANNVGAMSNYLMRMRTDPVYGKRKKELEALLKSIPKVGPQVAKGVDRLKDSLKYFLVEGMLFEELGFIYLGPINGHNIEEMKRAFERAKAMKAPVLVHVKTIKGKGYQPAEENPDLFHGIGPFDRETGRPLAQAGRPTYTQAFGETLCQLGAEDSRITAITAAMISGTGVGAFFEKFPQRSFDVGIAEAHALTFGAGLAAAGMRPIIALYSTFLQRAYDQLLHDICLPRLPVILAIDRAGLVGEDGPTHHGVFDLSYLRSLPNLTLMAPKDTQELRAMLLAASKYERPVALRYPRGMDEALWPAQGEAAAEDIPWGKGEILRTGADITILACGSMVAPAWEAAAILAEKGIQAAVVNIRFIQPLDEELILSLALKSKKVMTIEENIARGGFGSACLELLQNRGVETLVCALPNHFIEQGDRSFLLDKYGLSGEKLAQRALATWFPLKEEAGAYEG